MALDFAEPAVSRGRLPSDTPMPAWNSNARKRPRHGLLPDDMPVEEYSHPLRGKRTKKADSFNKPAIQPYARADPFAGPSAPLAPKSDPVFPYPISKTPLIVADSSRVEPQLEHADSLPHFDNVHDQLAQARSDIVCLKRQLELEIQKQEAEKRYITQTMMLDIVCIKKAHSELVDKLQRQKYHATQHAKEQAVESDKLRREADEDRARHAKLLVENAFYKDEAEHLHTLNKVMEEDLDELRQIENEDRSNRSRQKSDLPPAYGSLHDDERYPIPHFHQDGGSFDVAAFKRTVRQDFMLKLSNAHKRSDSLRAHADSAKTTEIDAIIFTDMSAALADSSRSLKAALEYATQISRVSTSKHRHSIARRMARQDFVASRVAKAVLDLTWRVIAATELRPIALRLSSSQKATLCLAYKEADVCLRDALGKISPPNRTGNDQTRLLYDYQHYYTQISALRPAFHALDTGLGYQLFKDSCDWLGDQIETERMNLANCDPVAIGQDIPNEDQAVGSEVSSETSRREGDGSLSNA